MDSILSILWNPNVDFFTLFGIHIRYYSLCWMIGLALAYFIVQRLYKQQHIKPELFDPLFIYCFFGILIGARLGHCLFYEPGYYLAHPIDIISPFRHTAAGWKFTGYEGLASHGGTLGLMIALWLYVRKTKVNIVRVLDNIAIATPITACFIRLGNLMNSEIVGNPTSMPWGFIFARNGEDFARHPAQLYEAIAYLIIFIVGWYLYKKHAEKVGTGFFFGYCLATIFTFRFFVEFFKAAQVDFENSMMLNMGQWLSIPFIIIGIACMVGGKWIRRFSDSKQQDKKR